ncbi:MAG: hypothetical protein WBC62_10105 [Candidatus Macondimonas sp.]
MNIHAHLTAIITMESLADRKLAPRAAWNIWFNRTASWPAVFKAGSIILGINA